jgi:predicted transcriptional regulator
MESGRNMARFNIDLAKEVLNEMETEAEKGELGDVSREYIKGMEFVVEEMSNEDNDFIKGVIDFIREYDEKKRNLLKPKNG